MARKKLLVVTIFFWDLQHTEQLQILFSTKALWLTDDELSADAQVMINQ